MTTLPRLSEETEESFDLSTPPSSKHSNIPSYNFSRPRPVRVQSEQSRLSHESEKSRSNTNSQRPSSSSEKGNVHMISAFHDPERDLPTEPRFSSESDRATIKSSENSASSQFTWDGERGELRALRSASRQYDRQRYERDLRPRSDRSKSSSSKSSGGSSTEPWRQQIARATLAGNKGVTITKRVSLDQQSERLSMSTDAHEDEASHHTVSDEGDSGSGSFDMEGNWQSSTYDTSSLSDSQIRKLVKKGINPSLYAEMQAAKKGRSKLIGPLLGNSFLG